MQTITEPPAISPRSEQSGNSRIAEMDAEEVESFAGSAVHTAHVGLKTQPTLQLGLSAQENHVLYNL